MMQSNDVNVGTALETTRHQQVDVLGTDLDPHHGEFQDDVFIAQ
jgi:hypothetical protein